MSARKPTPTPGPWAWDDEKESLYGDYNGSGELVLCGEWHNDGTASVGYENEADLALIAAAPDLLAACRALMVWTETNSYLHNHDAELVRLIEAAIAKAEGR
jgi:hypothetical protein